MTNNLYEPKQLPFWGVDSKLVIPIIRFRSGMRFSVWIYWFCIDSHIFMTVSFRMCMGDHISPTNPKWQCKSGFIQTWSFGNFNPGWCSTLRIEQHYDDVSSPGFTWIPWSVLISASSVERCLKTCDTLRTFNYYLLLLLTITGRGDNQYITHRIHGTIVYLPTFTINIHQMLVNISYMDGLYG